ncbi:MAG: cytochrome c biogenesis protein CcsA [Spirochaetes bacterium]|nr:cytochrome c biogenesis protein CcsA [Spirochaetota bacterium]MBU1082188.1 cytochrome c biogenesis protein CcsA [Spirochaetota bacterium]
MSLDSVFANAAFALFLASAAVQVVFIFKRNAGTDAIGPWILLAASASLLVALALRSLEVGFVALTSTYESLAFFAAVIGAVCFAYRYQRRLPYKPAAVFGSTMVAVVMLAVASSPLIPKEALPPIPALRSAWLLLHVSFTFVGEAFFVAGFVTSILFLFSKDGERRLELDRLTYTAIAVGYPFFTAGALVFGAIWAEQAWGRWWSWDPKETWGLITWLVYTAYLHLRLVMKRKDSLPAIVAVAGFLCAAFTFFGVNYLLPGLHSYG